MKDMLGTTGPSLSFISFKRLSFEERSLSHGHCHFHCLSCRTQSLSHWLDYPFWVMMKKTVGSWMDLIWWNCCPLQTLEMRSARISYLVEFMAQFMKQTCLHCAPLSNLVSLPSGLWMRGSWESNYYTWFVWEKTSANLYHFLLYITTHIVQEKHNQ